MAEITTETILEAVGAVEHPEIVMSLIDLGMVRGVGYDPERNVASATLVIPFMGIPEVIRNSMLNGLYEAMKQTGVETVEFDIAEMTEEERQEFFFKEQTYWKA